MDEMKKKKKKTEDLYTELYTVTREISSSGLV